MSLAKSIEKSGVGSPKFRAIMARYANDEIKDTKELVKAKNSLALTLRNIESHQISMNA